MPLSVLPDLALGNGEGRLKNLRGAERDNPQRLRAAAEEFEAVMLNLMVKEMRKNVPDSPIFGKDTGREIFNEMLDDQYVRLMTQRGGIGLADMLVRQLKGK